MGGAGAAVVSFDDPQNVPAPYAHPLGRDDPTEVYSRESAIAF